MTGRRHPDRRDDWAPQQRCSVCAIREDEAAQQGVPVHVEDVTAGDGTLAHLEVPLCRRCAREGWDVAQEYVRDLIGGPWRDRHPADRADRAALLTPPPPVVCAVCGGPSAADECDRCARLSAMGTPADPLRGAVR